MNHFRILEDIPFLKAFYIGRVPGLKLPTDRQEALRAQIPFFKRAVHEILPTATKFFCANEVHGTEIALLSASAVEGDEIFGLVPNVDGMITMKSHVALGITVADCAPVWIVDLQRKAVALIHSGKRGTEAEIVPKAIQMLQEKFGSQSKDLIVTIGPCIRPPCYEIDFAKTIRKQAAQARVGEVRDEGICTACDLKKYYSYRREKGKTGHMLAVVMILKT